MSKRFITFVLFWSIIIILTNSLPLSCFQRFFFSLSLSLLFPTFFLVSFSLLTLASHVQFFSPSLNAARGNLLWSKTTIEAMNFWWVKMDGRERMKKETKRERKWKKKNRRGRKWMKERERRREREREKEDWVKEGWNEKNENELEWNKMDHLNCDWYFHFLPIHFISLSLNFFLSQSLWFFPASGQG